MSDISELTDCRGDRRKWEYHLRCDERFATWLKTKMVIDVEGKQHCYHRIVPLLHAAFSSEAWITLSSSFSEEFPPSYSLFSESMGTSVKPWVTTPHGVECTVMPLKHPPWESVTGRFELKGPPNTKETHLKRSQAQPEEVIGLFTEQQCLIGCTLPRGVSTANR